MNEHDLLLFSRPKLKQRCHSLKISGEGTKGAMIGRILSYYDARTETPDIPLILNNIGNYDITPIQAQNYYQVPLNMNSSGNYPIMPINSDPAPIININKISNMVSTHRSMSSAVNELAKKLPFSQATNYIVAISMITDLFPDDVDTSINLVNDMDTNEYNTPLGGIEDIIALFSSNMLQKLQYTGQGDEKQEEKAAATRKYFIGGNWKCNGTMKSVSHLADSIARIDTSGVDVLIAPLSIHIPLVQSLFAAQNSNIIISSQNVSATATGAFTGEISAKHLKDMNVASTLIGHSERRKYYGESNEIITAKIKMALANKLKLVCCLGETLEERNANRVKQVCFAALQAISDGVGLLGVAGWHNIVIAYEPVWAIGTGVACSPSKAQETHKSLRKWFKDNVSAQIAQEIRIIYGGSVKPNNCKQLIAAPDIDGFLVGGASLKSDSYAAIIASVQSASAMPTMKKRKIVICGGGNAAHVFTALTSANPRNEVHLLSLYSTEAADFKRALNKTGDKLLTVEVTQEKRQIRAAPYNVTNDASCLADTDIVILSLPAFAHSQYLNAIKANIKPRKGKKTLVAVFPGASGLECEWQSIFGAKQNDFALLSCITLPWACRILKFGQKAEILGTKNQVEVSIKATMDDEKTDGAAYIAMINDLIGSPPKIVNFGHILNMSLSAVNAIIHPPIMYSQWKDWDGRAVKKKPLFYQSITKKGAKCMSSLSDEALEITRCVEKETGLTLVTQHIFDWYKSCYGPECSDTSTLQMTIRTNPSYNGLTHPCVVDKASGGFKPNFKYRYLTEDIPMGLCVIRGLSLILDKKYKKKCKAPVMDSIIKWAQKMVNKEYLKYKKDGSIVVGKDINETRAPQRYGITSIKDLV